MAEFHLPEIGDEVVSTGRVVQRWSDDAGSWRLHVIRDELKVVRTMDEALSGNKPIQMCPQCLGTGRI